MRLNIYGIEALTKFLDAMTTQQSHQFIVVRTDSHQSYLPSNERGFIIEVYDSEDHYIKQWELSEITYTLDEAKKILGLDYVLDEWDLGTEEKHIENFFKLNEEVQEEYDEAYKELEKSKKKKK